jgi:hypothetical protein
MFSIAELTAAPREVQLLGRTYLISPFRFIEFGRLQRYIDEHAESPLVRASRLTRGMDPPDRAPIMAEAKEAMARWTPPQIGQEDQRRPILCPECKAFVDRMPRPLIDGDTDWREVLLGRPEGQRFFLRLLLSRHQPLDEPTFDKILAAMDKQGADWVALRDFAFEMEASPDPKAQAETGPTVENGEPVASTAESITA